MQKLRSVGGPLASFGLKNEPKITLSPTRENCLAGPFVNDHSPCAVIGDTSHK